MTVKQEAAAALIMPVLAAFALLVSALVFCFSQGPRLVLESHEVREQTERQHVAEPQPREQSSVEVVNVAPITTVAEGGGW